MSVNDAAPSTPSLGEPQEVISQNVGELLHAIMTPPSGAFTHTFQVGLPFACCDHCGCRPGQRIGHDDTCRFGCNDTAVDLGEPQ